MKYFKEEGKTLKKISYQEFCEERKESKKNTHVSFSAGDGFYISTIFTGSSDEGLPYETMIVKGSTVEKHSWPTRDEAIQKHQELYNDLLKN